MDDLHMGEPTASDTCGRGRPNRDAKAVHEPEPPPPPTTHSELMTHKHVLIRIRVCSNAFCVP